MVSLKHVGCKPYEDYFYAVCPTLGDTINGDRDTFSGFGADGYQ